MSMSFDFTGRTVLVTGAGQGIGLALAQAFRVDGARVVVLDRDEAVLATAWGEADPDHTLVRAVDVTDAAGVGAVVTDAVERFGSLDVVVNNAGITRDAVVWKMTDDQWDAVLRVHLTGTFTTTRAAVPVMRSAGYGRIINVTSFSGLHGNVGQANYAAAKAGVVGFTKTVAKEVARFGITVNAISPNAATAMVAAVPADKLAELTQAIPVGRFAKPAEMAAAVQFLASEQSAYITGVVLPTDGGMAM